MKRGTPDHPKTKALAAILGLKRWQVVGLLESLWHFAGQYARRGNIGKWSNEEIAAAMEWEGNPGDLIAALVKSRWVDECTQYRLVIHDWHDHADQTIMRSDEVRKLGFASCVLADASSNHETEISCYTAGAGAGAGAGAKPSLGFRYRDEADGRDETIRDGDFCVDWEEVRRQAQRFNGLGMAATQQDKDFLFKTCALTIHGDIPRDWLEQGLETLQKAKGKTKKPPAYFTKCIQNRAKKENVDLKVMLAQMKIPEEMFNPLDNGNGAR